MAATLIRQGYDVGNPSSVTFTTHDTANNQTFGTKIQCNRDCHYNLLWYYWAGNSSSSWNISGNVFDPFGSSLTTGWFSVSASTSGGPTFQVMLLPNTISVFAGEIVIPAIWADAGEDLEIPGGVVTPALPFVKSPFTSSFSLKAAGKNFPNVDASAITNNPVVFLGTLEAFVDANDSNTLSDLLARSLGYTPKFSDTLNISDAFASLFGSAITVAVSENIQIAENLAPAFNALIGPNDILALSDSYDGFSLTIPFAVGDSLAFADNVVMPGSAYVDYLSFYDTVALASGIPFRVGSENLIFNDVVVTALIGFKSTSDSFALLDSVGRGQLDPTIDNVVLSDAVAFQVTATIAGLNVNLTDSYTLLDSFQKSDRNPYLADQMVFSDDVFPLLVSVPDNYLRRYLNDVL